MAPMGEKIDLHGMTVDEALPRVEQFLQAAFRSRYYRVWIVHGKGSGVLREEVGIYLSGHPLVRRHALADRYHGGDGATEVDLEDNPILKSRSSGPQPPGRGLKGRDGSAGTGTARR